MAPKSDFEKRMLVRLEAEVEKKKKGGAEPQKTKDKAEAAPSLPSKRIKILIKAGKGPMLTRTTSGASDSAPTLVKREEAAKSAEERPFRRVTTPLPIRANLSIAQVQLVTTVRPGPSSDLRASSISLPIEAGDTLEHPSTATLYRAHMFSEEDLRRLGHMKASGLDFVSSVLRFMLEGLLHLKGLEETRQSEIDTAGRWRVKANEEKEARRKAEAAESKIFAENEGLKVLGVCPKPNSVTTV